MFNFKERPYNVLLLAAILILIASFFTSVQTIDIYIYDTIFVITIKHLFWIIITLLLMLWALYSLTKRFLFSKLLIWIHVMLSIIISLYLVSALFFAQNSNKGLAGIPRRYYDNETWIMIKYYSNLTEGVALALFILIAGVLIYIINLIVGLFKKSFYK